MLVDGDTRVGSIVDAFSSASLSPPDPRVIQSMLGGLVVVDVLAHAVAGTPVVGLPLVGAVLMWGLVVVAWAAPWDRVHPAWSAGLAGLDLLGVGLSRLDPDVGGPIALAALPAYYLGRHFGRAGVLGAAAGTAGLIALPQVAVLGLGAPQNVRLLTTSLIVVAGAQIAALTVARLRRERQVAVAIVNSLPVGVILVDATGRYSAMNETQAEIMAHAYPTGSTETAARIFDADGVTPLDRGDYPSARAARGEELDGVVVWIGSDSKTRRALSVTARVVHDARGTFSGASLACHDITGLLRAGKIKDDFVAAVSHELRTPLTSVLGYLEMALERDDVPHDVRDQLAVARRNATRLESLVGDLLETADAGRGMTSLTRSPTDVVDLLGHAVTAARPSAEARGVRIELDAPAALSADVDGVRVGQVLDNLLSNAIKFTPRGGAVSICARDEDADLVIEVVDDGPGFEAADQDLLFTRFYRSDRARTDVVAGVGLGLSIVHEIVTAHGGVALAANHPARGAALTVRIPRG